MVPYILRRRQDARWEAVIEGSSKAFMVFDTEEDVTAFLNAMPRREADVKAPPPDFPPQLGGIPSAIEKAR